MGFLKAKSQGQIGLKTPFVKLVEDDQPHPGKLRVILEAAGQDPAAWP